MRLRGVGLILCALAIPTYGAVARDGSRTVGDHAAASHSSPGKDKGNLFHTLEGQIQTMVDPKTDPDYANFLSQQLGGTFENGYAEGRINKQQLDRLRNDLEHALDTGEFSGHSGALGSSDIGGIP